MSTTREIAASLGAWLKASLINAVVLVLLFTIGLAIVGVPWWLFFGLACGVLNLLPWIGPVLSLLVAAYAGLFVPAEGWTGAAMTSAVWLLIQIIDGFVLAPRAASRAGVHPLFSIPLVIVAAMFFGPVGAILAVPLVAILLIIWRTSRRSRAGAQRGRMLR
jgi:predicted PurR-regulated permease PerM